jgi:plasmid stability protein
MSKTIQLRNIPDKLHRKLRARAACAGMTLSDFVIREMQKIVAQPTHEEIRRRIVMRPVVKLDVSAADLIREERDARDRHLSGTPRAR